MARCTLSAANVDNYMIAEMSMLVKVGSVTTAMTILSTVGMSAKRQVCSRKVTLLY